MSQSLDSTLHQLIKLMERYNHQNGLRSELFFTRKSKLDFETKILSSVASVFLDRETVVEAKKIERLISELHSVRLSLYRKFSVWLVANVTT